MCLLFVQIINSEPISTLFFLQGMDIPDTEWENSGLPHDDHSDTACPLTDEQMTASRDAVNPRAASQSFGCDIYIAAV